MTARALEAIGEVGGPRCCKRDSYLSILRAVDFVKENMGIEMEKSEIVCSYSSQNNQCIGKGVRFLKQMRRKRRLRLSVFITPAGVRLRKRSGRNTCRILMNAIPPEQKSSRRSIRDAVRLMKREYGIDMEKEQYSKLLDDIPEADIYVSMGCNVACPNIPGEKDHQLGTGRPDRSGGCGLSGCDQED